MNTKQVYDRLEGMAMELLSLEYGEENISDKLFDEVDRLYLNDDMRELTYEQMNCKVIDSIIVNAKLKLNLIGVV